MDLKSKLQTRILELSSEAEKLVNIRDRLIKDQERVDLRLSQISGAIKELDSLLSEDKNEVVATNQPANTNSGMPDPGHSA